MIDKKTEQNHTNKNILVIHGPNLNMLGIREPGIYGNSTLADLENYIKEEGNKLSLSTTFFQSNHEGAIVDAIQEGFSKFDGIIINAGAYTHTSIAILDSLKAVDIPTIEVHLSDISNREFFRKFSYISFIAKKTIYGMGFLGYKKALEYFSI
ncbi:MAG: type II 3-dehydroquinate dehydratase [Christensenellaceae bacterium]|nr:type II 3-dehydroquinate dehydratase [Christensenellaceae bacterium]